MEKPNTRTEMKFVEGQGYEIREVPIDAPSAAGARVVPGAALPPAQPVVLALTSLATEELVAELTARGFVVVQADDYRELLERNRELELMLDHAAGKPHVAAAAAVPPLPVAGKKGGKVTKGSEVTPATLEAQILAATDLDALTALTKDLGDSAEDKALLALANERAAELEESGA